MAGESGFWLEPDGGREGVKRLKEGCRGMRAVVWLVPLLVLLPGCVDPGAPGGDGPEGDGAAPVRFEAIRFETELGAFTAILFPEEHPETTAFMKRLVEEGYYEGREFGRVIPTFVIQEVDRTGGTTDQPDRVPLEAPTSMAFSAGALGIARDADPNSGGSEFFVMDFAVSPLYANYTAWAQVVEGMDVVHAIARVPAANTGPASSVVASPPGAPVYFGLHDRVPVDPVKMTKLTLVEVEMPASEAARYPLRVGESYRSDTVRATLEWPANLDAGAPSALTWYAASRQARDPPVFGEPRPLEFDGSVVRVLNATTGEALETISTTQDPKAPGKLAWTWTPPARGTYVVHLEKEGALLALSNVTVPTPPPHLGR